MDVRIHQCRLRVVRHGGWTWGLDRSRLVDLASDALPGLIFDALSNLPLETGLDAHITHLRLRLGSHAGAIAAGDYKHPSPRFGAWRASVERQLCTQIATESPELLRPAQEDQEPPTAAEPAFEVCADSAGVLARWRSDGLLSILLRRFDLAALAAWEREWIAFRRSRPPPQETGRDLLVREAQSLLRVLPDYGADTPGIRRQRLHLAAELDFRRSGRIGADALETVLARLLPVAPHSAVDDGSSQTPASYAVAQDHAASPPAVIDTARQESGQVPLNRDETHSTWTEVDTQVASVLPFLVLGTLQRIGYLDTLAATLASKQAMEFAPCFASALAVYLLPEQRAGKPLDEWMSHVIATFSAQAQAPGPQTYADFERWVGPVMSAADASIFAALLRGHTADVPLLVTDFGNGWMLFDTEGMFPAAAEFSAADLEACLHEYETGVVLLPVPAVDSDMIRRIGYAGCSFITNAPPARTDRWVAVDRERRFWTHRDTPAPLESARYFDECSSAAGLFAGAHVAARRLSPAGTTQLEASAALAAGVGLADLAHTLWGDREFAHPLMAYERLHDLEARVRVDAEQVRVSPALGKRFLDLRDAGLLCDVTGAPWLGGRKLVYSGL